MGGLNASVPSIQFTLPVIGFGISLLAVLSAVLQVIQTRMMTPRTDDPQAATQQRIFLVLPLISVVYGQFLPAGLFLYWIMTTIFSIGQQYLIAGWGGLFPLFGWTPAFVAGHTPRFPVPPPVARPRTGESDSEAPSTRRTPAEKAQGTVRPAKDRGRTSRRGRRR
jgi:YidC/Oxa1 family membrane protein insertase